MMQLLIVGKRTSLGNAEVWKRVPRLRIHLRMALSFAVTAKADEQSKLAQPAGLQTWLCSAGYFDLMCGSRRGEWGSLHQVPTLDQVQATWLRERRFISDSS